MIKTIVFTSFLVVFFTPLVFVFWQIINGLIENLTSIEYFISSNFFLKIYNSIILCLGVSFLSFIFALVSAFSFFSTDKLWQKQMLFFLLLIIFAISPIIYLSVLSKFIWFSELNIYVQSVFILSIKLFPLATIIFVFSFSKIEASSIKIALLSTSLKNVFKHIVMPQMYPSLISAFLIIFMLTFTHEEVPSFLGYRTYAGELLSYIVVMDNISQIAFIFLPFLVFSFLILTILFKILKIGTIFNIKSTPYTFLNYQKSTTSMIVVILILVVALIFLLFKEFGTSDVYLFFLDNLDALKNSFFLSFLAGAIGTIVSVLLYPFIYYNSYKFTKYLLLLSMLLYWLLPSSLISLGLIEISSYIDQYNIFIGYSLIVLAYLIKLIPIALFLLFSFDAIKKIDVFVKLRNISHLNILQYITIPLEWTKWFILSIILTVFSLNELSSTILLIPPGEETIIIKMYNLMHYGDFASVAFLSLLQMFLIFTFVCIAGYLLRRQYDYPKKL